MRFHLRELGGARLDEAARHYEEHGFFVVEGLRMLDVPAFGLQYHPEAAPGPHDAAGEFDAFCALMERAR